MENKKESLKKLFYTSLTKSEIQYILELKEKEYTELLHQVKKELGLSNDYYRTPNLFKYRENKFFVAKKINDDEIEIKSYFPTFEMADDFKKNNSNDEKLIIGQATKETMKELIYTDYYERLLKWDRIIQKYNISYHTFYRLLNEVKKENGKTGSRTANKMRYIQSYSKKKLWKIRKSVDGVQRDFGVYDSLETAITVRNYLETISWDIEKWNNTSVEEILSG